MEPLLSGPFCERQVFFKGPFTLSVSINAVMLRVISLLLNCLDFLINQAIRYDASINADTPNQSLTHSVKVPLSWNVCDETLFHNQRI